MAAVTKNFILTNLWRPIRLMTLDISQPQVQGEGFSEGESRRATRAILYCARATFRFHNRHFTCKSKRELPKI